MSILTLQVPWLVHVLQRAEEQSATGGHELGVVLLGEEQVTLVQEQRLVLQASVAGVPI